MQDTNLKRILSRWDNLSPIQRYGLLLRLEWYTNTFLRTTIRAALLALYLLAYIIDLGNWESLIGGAAALVFTASIIPLKQ